MVSASEGPVAVRKAMLKKHGNEYFIVKILC